jgi:Ca2+-binding RTX toxin-like protein
MQYDQPVSAQSVQNSLNSSSLSSNTLAAISSVLGLNSSTSANANVAVTNYDGNTVNTVHNSNGEAVAPQLVLLNNLGSSGSQVTLNIPNALANAHAFVFDTQATVTVTFGASAQTAQSAQVVKDAPVNTADFGRVIVGGTGGNTLTVTDNVSTYIDGGAGNDTITLAGGNDTVVLHGGVNTVKTGAGNDVVYAGNGKDTIEGGAGFDVVVVNGKLADYGVKVGSDGTVTLSSTSSTAPGVVMAKDVTFFTDADGKNSLTVTSTETQASAVRMYEALLGRSADQAGTHYWLDNVAANGGNVTSIASAFLASSEYQSKMGGASDATFVQSLYQNMLGRSADAAGLAYWESTLADGASRASVVVSIVGSAEAQQHDTGVLVIAGQV